MPKAVAMCTGTAQHSSKAYLLPLSTLLLPPSKDLSANMTAWDLHRHDRSSNSSISPKEPEGAVVFALWKPITNNQVVYSVIVCVSVCVWVRVCGRHFMGPPCARLLLLGHVDHVTTGQRHLFNKLLHLITKTDKENVKGKTRDKESKMAEKRKWNAWHFKCSSEKLKLMGMNCEKQTLGNYQKINVINILKMVISFKLIENLDDCPLKILVSLKNILNQIRWF